MFIFCDVLHETKRKNAIKLSRVRSTDWKSFLTQELRLDIYYSSCFVDYHLYNFHVVCLNFEVLLFSTFKVCVGGEQML